MIIQNEVIKEISELLLSRYQIGLEASMNDYAFDGVNLLYCKCHKINFKLDSSCVDSPEWRKKKKATTNPRNKDDKCFQYVAMVPLNHGENKWNPERFSNIKPLINKYNWDKIKYPSKIDDWKTFEKNDSTIAVNVLYTKEMKMEICQQIILLIILNEKRLPLS